MVSDGVHWDGWGEGTSTRGGIVVIEQCTLALEDGQIGYHQEVSEGAKGPTWLYLHGCGCTPQIWHPMMEHHQPEGELAKLPALALALPGRDGSTGPALSQLTPLVDWLWRVCDALALEQVVVVGHSYGGALAQLMALSQPSRVKGLALLATGARLRAHPMIFKTLEEAKAAQQEPDIFAPIWQEHTPTSLREQLTTSPIDSTIADWHAVDSFDQMTNISKISCPTLVVSGDMDIMTPPKYGRYLADHIPQATYQLLDEAGHMMIYETPNKIAAALALWWDKYQSHS